MHRLLRNSTSLFDNGHADYWISQKPNQYYICCVQNEHGTEFKEILPVRFTTAMPFSDAFMCGLDSARAESDGLELPNEGYIYMCAYIFMYVYVYIYLSN